MQDNDVRPLREQTINLLETWNMHQQLAGHDNGTLMLMYYNACIGQDLVKKMAIVEIMNGRGWYVHQTTPHSNPTWMGHSLYQYYVREEQVVAQ
jgi:hypothetical protein